MNTEEKKCHMQKSKKYMGSMETILIDFEKGYINSMFAGWSTEK